MRYQRRLCGSLEEPECAVLRRSVARSGSFARTSNHPTKYLLLVPPAQCLPEAHTPRASASLLSRPANSRRLYTASVQALEDADDGAPPF